MCVYVISDDLVVTKVTAVLLCLQQCIRDVLRRTVPTTCILGTVPTAYARSLCLVNLVKIFQMEVTNMNVPKDLIYRFVLDLKFISFNMTMTCRRSEFFK